MNRQYSEQVRGWIADAVAPLKQEIMDLRDRVKELERKQRQHGKWHEKIMNSFGWDDGEKPDQPPDRPELVKTMDEMEYELNGAVEQITELRHLLYKHCHSGVVTFDDYIKNPGQLEPDSPPERPEPNPYIDNHKPADLNEVREFIAQYSVGASTEEIHDFLKHLHTLLEEVEMLNKISLDQVLAIRDLRTENAKLRERNTELQNRLSRYYE